MMPAYRRNRFYALYFIVFLVIGMLLAGNDTINSNCIIQLWVRKNILHKLVIWN